MLFDAKVILQSYYLSLPLFRESLSSYVIKYDYMYDKIEIPMIGQGEGNFFSIQG